MLGTIYRSGVMSDIYHSGVQFNLDYTFCSYTTNTENQSADIKLSLSAGKKITIFWGDGESTIITGEVTETIYSHTYTDVKTYNLTVTGDYNDITYLRFSGDGSYSGNIKYMPTGLTYFSCNGQNIISGDIQYLPSGLAFFGCGGQNIISGNIKYLPIGLTFFACYGQNIILGDIQYLPVGLTIFDCGGNSTILGNIKYLPSGLTYFGCSGYNTISNYTGKTWTTNMSYFKIVPISPGGLSSSEMDLLLNDLDNDLDWSDGGTITLTGTNAPRTSASDDAVSNIEAEGGTIFTN